MTAIRQVYDFYTSRNYLKNCIIFESFPVLAVTVTPFTVCVFKASEVQTSLLLHLPPAFNKTLFLLIEKCLLKCVSHVTVTRIYDENKACREPVRSNTTPTLNHYDWRHCFNACLPRPPPHTHPPLPSVLPVPIWANLFPGHLHFLLLLLLWRL